MITVGTCVREDEIWFVIDESLRTKNETLIRDFLLNNVHETLANQDDIEVVLIEGFHIHDTLLKTYEYENEDVGKNFDSQRDYLRKLEEVESEILKKINEKIGTADILTTDFKDKEWNENYRDVNITFDIDVNKIIEEMNLDEEFKNVAEEEIERD